MQSDIDKAVEAEREACAKVVEEHFWNAYRSPMREARAAYTEKVAAAIRKRVSNEKEYKTGRAIARIGRKFHQFGNQFRYRWHLFL